MTPGSAAPPAASVQTMSTAGAFSAAAGSGGKAGTGSSVQVAPPSSERCSFTPKCPSRSAA
jgi:hypothetical protein